MKEALLLAFSVFLLNACSSPNSSSSNTPPNSRPQNVEIPALLTPEQDSAFDALNTLQVSTDERYHLYSTFAWTAQPCLSPDTSISISQADFGIAMKQFVNRHCQKLSATEREALAAASILAQEKYMVSLCLNDPTNVTYADGVPMTGTWLLSGVLGRRDVVIVW